MGNVNLFFYYSKNTIGKPLARRGAWALFCGVPTCGVKVIEF